MVARTLGSSEKVATDFAFVVERFANQNNTRNFWRFEVRDGCMGGATVYAGINATPQDLRNMARFCERAADTIERDGLDAKPDDLTGDDTGLEPAAGRLPADETN